MSVPVAMLMAWFCEMLLLNSRSNQSVFRYSASFR
ncbi:hypothetical protein EVA_21383 [gut metagenome]|uniref:Uncharacterized protein n=1 Tax=gut metagenome TaxID=749906 RepID=J9BSF8_9ZZZZ